MFSCPLSSDNRSLFLKFFPSLQVGQIVFRLSFCLGRRQYNDYGNYKTAHDYLLYLYVWMRGFGQSLFDLF